MSAASGGKAIKRYDMEIVGRYAMEYVTEEESSDGMWVRYADHAAAFGALTSIDDPTEFLAAVEGLREDVAYIIVAWEVHGAPAHMLDALKRTERALARLDRAQNNNNGE